MPVNRFLGFVFVFFLARTIVSFEYGVVTLSIHRPHVPICRIHCVKFSWCSCRAKQSLQAMELCHRSKRHGLTGPSGIYDLSVQQPHMPARNSHHAGNAAPTGAANTGGLVMANLDNNNLTLAHQLNALNTHVCAMWSMKWV